MTEDGTGDNDVCGSGGVDDFVIITYNAHSILAEERLDALLQELVGIRWDVVVVVETWRETKRETMDLEGGHTWYGSGGCRGRAGVGFIVN